ncbi:MAG: hypothetical protein ACJ75B_12900 [Flavisolibacter sp.]
MLPRFLPLVLICISSAFLSKAQDRKNLIHSTEISFTAKSVDHSGSNDKSIARDTTPCSCSVNPQITALIPTGTSRTYEGTPNAFCTGFSTSPGTEPSNNIPSHAYDTCGVVNVTYAWSVAIGNDIASINGSSTGPTVNVSINGSGNFTIRLENTVTCSSGSSCTNFTYYNDSAHLDSSHCNCTQGPVTIQPINKQGKLWTYQGNVQGNCTGQSGVPPNLSSCSVQNTSYQWSILAPGGVASISGSTTGQTVDVTINGDGPFTLRLDGTTTCTDGKTCTNYNFLDDSSKTETPRHCNCEAPGASVESTNRTESLYSYKVTVTGHCTGQFGTPPNLTDCGVQNITYHWFISSGGNVAEIMGNDQAPNVDVKIKGNGKFTVSVFGDVFCNEGNSCHYEAYMDDSSHSSQSCSMSVEEKVEPKMDGGLKQKYTGSRTIDRDGFILLGAEGKDYDQVVFTCNPSEQCNESGSNKTIALNGRVRFQWVISGEGSFVKLGGLPKDQKTDEGDNVIFQPPFVPLADRGNESSVTTTIQLSIIDDNPTQPLDPIVNRTVTIVTKRFKTSPDEYTVTVQSPGYSLPGEPKGSIQTGSCNVAGPTWEMKNNLQQPQLELPDVADNDKMVVGEWIVLKAKDQRDPDVLKIVCDSKTCKGDGHQKTYEDNVEWEWTLLPGEANGKLLSDPKGRFVVYQAPEKLPNKIDVVTVKIRLGVKNPDMLKLPDKEPSDTIISLKVYRAGIKVDYPPLTWLPEENNSVDIRSYLVYKNNGSWVPALAHQYRIQFFELLNVSREKGVCMNDPVAKDANECRDLYIDTAANHEAFNDKHGNNCKLTDLFLEARTKKPVQEYSIAIHSSDFGSYGFLRTHASRNSRPDYESVPITRAEVGHPSRTVEKKLYQDNRINIPRDIDENRIADGGWTAEGGVAIPDPASNQIDEDNLPLGDKFKGDGLTSYEEYRGFRIKKGDGITHIRTNPGVKDLFVFNANDLPLNLFREQSGLSVHEISEPQFESIHSRVVNFNFNQQTHTLNQKGLYLVDKGTHPALLGIANTTTGHPAPPNFVESIYVYQARIKTFSGAPRNIDFNSKLLQVVAHELGHGCNVYHHGEGNPADPTNFNQQHGLRSGNISCIMRYDNVDVNHVEAIGNSFCTSATGTGANANGGFGDANVNLCRGNCQAQFRVSGKEANYPKRTTHAECTKN